jgi:hypothetical protein
MGPVTFALGLEKMTERAIKKLGKEIKDLGGGKEKLDIRGEINIRPETIRISSEKLDQDPNSAVPRVNNNVR